jgi:hypothetical protein
VQARVWSLPGGGASLPDSIKSEAWSCRVSVPVLFDETFPVSSNVHHGVVVPDIDTHVHMGIVLKTGPATEPVMSSVQVFTGRTTGLLVRCLVF